MCACMYVCIYIILCCVCLLRDTNLYTCCAYIRTYIGVHEGICICWRGVEGSMCPQYAQACTYICTHTYTHTYVNAYKWVYVPTYLSTCNYKLPCMVCLSGGVCMSAMQSFVLLCLPPQIPLHIYFMYIRTYSGWVTEFLGQRRTVEVVACVELIFLHVLCSFLSDL